MGPNNPIITKQSKNIKKNINFKRKIQNFLMLGFPNSIHVAEIYKKNSGN
jgi:adenylate kinase family enzyme